MVNPGVKDMEVRNQKGQTVVEYILLLAVAVSLVVTIFRSNTFQRMFGEQGRVGVLYKSQAEFEYRHAFPWRSNFVSTFENYPSASQHPSYFPDRNGETHFFGPNDPYP
jgi:hypothetical protein